ncbi:hypothetical protein [Bacillus bingmayongensis]|uniref:hypothetical protein n=1 Tax=Bacillus bingmayongensis TaxID=1150157 RepID=UPI0003168083|nr:hypothetical protein [Bacillus bingmayongensis]
MIDKISDTFIVDLAVLRISSGAYIAGAAIDFLHFDDEENRLYTPYKVASFYIDDTEINSMTKCIKWLLKRLLEEVPEGVTQIIFRSNLPHLIRNRYYRKEIESLTNAEVFIKHIPMLGNKRNQIQLLANDALNRKSSVIGEIE